MTTVSGAVPYYASQSEHIPSEEEMDTWDSKIEASDTWLDRGINKAMGSLFGGGGDGDSKSE